MRLLWSGFVAQTHRDPVFLKDPSILLPIGRTSADLCEVFPLLMEEAVGTNNFLGGASRISNWIHISLDSVPWLPSHPYVSLEFVPKVCTAAKEKEVEERALGKM